MNGPDLASAPSLDEPRWWGLAPTALDAHALGVEHWSYALPGLGGALAWLRGLGLPPGSRLGLSTRSTPGTLAVLQAGPLLGICIVLLNRRLSPGEFARQVLDAAVAAVATDAQHQWAGRASALVPETFADQPWSRHELSPLAREDAALVLFTSGTSGRPKPARLSLRALTSAAIGACQRLGLGSEHTYLACLPLDHIGGASFAYRAALCGHRLLVVERFAVDLVSRLLPEADAISVVPTMLHRLLEARGGTPWPTRLRVLLVGGGPLSTALCARSAAAGLEPCQTYGLTECASQVCTLAPAEAASHRGSAGRALLGMEVEVRTPAGARCASDQVGAIAVRGGMLFSGYEQAGVVHAPQRAESWFVTGDLGSLDGDGMLHLQCRREDLILSGGENVYPREVEAALENHPGVAEVAVCGLPDAEWGQLVVAVVVPREGSLPPTPQALAAHCEARLARYKCPRRWLLVSQLPRSELGKLSRSALPALFAQG